MLAFIYIIASFSLGAGIIISLLPYLNKRLFPFTEEKTSVSKFFLFIPASYLTGTLILSWVTYFSAVAFKSTGKPLLYANILSLLLTLIFLALILYIKKTKLKKWFKGHWKNEISFSAMEWLILLSSLVFWSFFISRSLYMDGDYIRAGVSAFSDFGAHLPVIRSFSMGNNFPAQYPHYPDGTMRYHFMFYFLAGNLEYLGLNLPWALNLPSILSLVSFSMLLYGLAVGITKKPAAGLLACIFFAFRSSFAFFTFADGFNKISDFLNAIGKNLNADGSSREHIGNTLRESWGLWAQKVYINQRHLPFALGLFIISLYLLLPLFMNTINDIKTRKVQRKEKKKKESGILKNIKEIFFSKEAWLPESLIPCIAAGILLGSLAYWNGAVVISAISVFFLMAVFSKHKLEYLIMAVITFLLSAFQSKLFAGSGTGAVSIQFKPGFLTESRNISVIFSYITELLGILPFVLSGILIIPAMRKSKFLGYALSVILMIILFLLVPDIGIGWKLIILAVCALLLYNLVNWKQSYSLFIFPWYIPVFAAPIVLAFTLQLTPDITVNHKYIMLSVILLVIPVSDLLANMILTRKISVVLTGFCVIILLTLTGIIDLATLYNLDKSSVSYNEMDPVKLWVQEETNPDDIFLTHFMTHYNAPMSVMLAGRCVYSGYSYFTVTAGYDADRRDSIMKLIYSSDDPVELRTLAISEDIDYIVIEEQNRTAAEYNLNEDIFHKTFPVAFYNKARNIYVFRVQ